MILAILFYPIYAWLLQLLRGRATLAAIIVIVCITLLVIVPGLELGWFLSDEAVSLVKSVRSLTTEEGKQEWLAKGWVQQLIGWWNAISFSLLDFKISWKDGLLQGAQKSSAFVVGQVTGVAQNVLLFTMNFFVALLTLFFLLRDGGDFLRKFQRLLPMDREHQERLLKNIVDAVLAVIHGSFVVAVVQGLLAGIGLLVSRCAVRGVMGCGDRVCRAFTRRRLHFGFDSGIDLPISPRGNRAGNYLIGMVAGNRRHGGQSSQAVAHRQPSGIARLVSFFRHPWRSCSVRRGGHRSRAGVVCAVAGTTRSLSGRVCQR